MAAHSRPTEQNLFAIVQGGLDYELREISLRVGCGGYISNAPMLCWLLSVQTQGTTSHELEHDSIMNLHRRI